MVGTMHCKDYKIFHASMMLAVSNCFTKTCKTIGTQMLYDVWFGLMMWWFKWWCTGPLLHRLCPFSGSLTQFATVAVWPAKWENWKHRFLNSSPYILSSTPAQRQLRRTYHGEATDGNVVVMVQHALILVLCKRHPTLSIATSLHYRIYFSPKWPSGELNFLFSYSGILENNKYQ